MAGHNLAHHYKPGVSGNPSGRPKKLLKRVEVELFEKGISPLQEILKLIPDLDKYGQAKIWLEVLSYVESKPKEHAPDNDPLANLSDEELMRLVREKLPPLKEAG